MSNYSVKNASAYGLPVWSADTPVTAESLNKLSEGIASAMQNLETRLSTAGGTINGPLEVAGGLTRAGNAVYDTGNKPTAADVGALPVGVSQITTPENFAVDPNAENVGWASGLDIKNKGVRYGCFGGLGNSRTNTFSYLFVGREYDDANAFRWHHNGKLSVGDDVLRTENGDVLEHGARVYSPNNKPSAADTDAVPGQLYYRGSARKTLVPGNYMIFNPASIVDHTNSLYTSGSFFIFAIVTDRDGKHRLRGMCDGTYIEYTAVEFLVQNYEMVHDIFIYKLS